MAPFRKMTKKELTLKQYPWISHGIITSMKKRDKLYKDFLIERDITAKNNTHAKYKRYRNMIISLIRKSKRKYYFDFFTEHNTNVKKTWEGILQLVNVNKKKSVNIKLIYENSNPITDNKGMANAFNSFYSNLGNSIEQKIPKGRRSFSSYLDIPINSNFHALPCDESEIASIISNIGIKKASGPNSIPTHLLKEFSTLLIYPIKILVNKSLTEGTFPSLLKTAQVCPMRWKSSHFQTTNYYNL